MYNVRFEVGFGLVLGFRVVLFLGVGLGLCLVLGCKVRLKFGYSLT